MPPGVANELTPRRVSSEGELYTSMYFVQLCPTVAGVPGCGLSCLRHHGPRSKEANGAMRAVRLEEAAQYRRVVVNPQGTLDMIGWFILRLLLYE